MRRILRSLALGAAVASGALAFMPGRAVAEVEGPCTASVGSIDVTSGRDTPGSAIDVQADQRLEVAGTSDGVVEDLTYTIEIAGGGVQVADVAIAGDGRSWRGHIDLEGFTWAGVGLYEVTADARTSAGPCGGTVFICVEGRFPLATVAGGGATAVGLGGALLLAFSLFGARRMGAGRAGVQGFAGGALTAAGAGVLLQQFCVVPLTLVTAAAVPAGIGVVGAAGALGLRRAGRAAADRAADRLRRPRPGAPDEPTETLERTGAPGGPTDAIDRGGAEPDRAGRPDARSSEALRGGEEQVRSGSPDRVGAGAGPQASAPGGPSPAPPSGGGPAGGPSPAPPGGGGGGPSPAPPGAGGPSGGPSPAPPSGGGPGGGPSPAPPAGGPSPAPPAGGGAEPSPAPPGGQAPPAPGAAPPAGGAEGGVLPPVALPRSEELECPNCGESNSPDSVFCTNCGTRLRG